MQAIDQDHVRYRQRGEANEHYLEYGLIDSKVMCRLQLHGSQHRSRDDKALSDDAVMSERRMCAIFAIARVKWRIACSAQK